MSDYISREQAVRSARFIYDSDSQLKALTMMRMLRELPSVTPTERTGHWIFVDTAHEHAHCSECDYGNVDLLDGRPHNYCPNCGVKMVEPQESEGAGMKEVTLELLIKSLINDFRDYQKEWLTSHNDIEFNRPEEDLILAFLDDTADCYISEHIE